MIDDPANQDEHEVVIRPYEGFGPVNFGDTSQIIESKLGEPTQRCRRKGVADAKYIYQELGLQVMFDAEKKCVFLQTVTSRCVAIVEGLRMEGGFDDLARLLSERRHAPESSSRIGASIDFPDIGVGIWREDVESQQIDSVFAWQKGSRGKTDARSEGSSS